VRRYVLSMTASGRVIGGVYLDSTVSTATFGSDLVVQSGFKGRRITAETVETWAKIPVEARVGTFQAMGKAAAGVALPGRFGKAASAAVGAAFDSKRPTHVVRIDWADGNQSLIQLPDELFTHLELVLGERRIEAPESTADRVSEVEEAKPSITDKAFDLVSGLVKDRFSTQPPTLHETSSQPQASNDVMEQLQKLASLRDAGVISDDEFVAKKTELLGRL
jgi:hypothetical protein